MLAILVVSICASMPAENGATRIMCRAGRTDPISVEACKAERRKAITLREKGWSVEATCLPVIVSEEDRPETPI